MAAKSSTAVCWPTSLPSPVRPPCPCRFIQLVSDHALRETARGHPSRSSRTAQNVPASGPVETGVRARTHGRPVVSYRVPIIIREPSSSMWRGWYFASSELWYTDTVGWLPLARSWGGEVGDFARRCCAWVGKVRKFGNWVTVVE